MSDERFTLDPEDEANANGERPYLDVPPPGVRPARRQPTRQELVSADEIEAFIRREYPETQKSKRRLVRPEGWDQPAAAENGDAYEEPDPEQDWRNR
jgi:hypothetical protein